MGASAVAVEERKAPCLAAVGTCYLVFRRHLLSEMTEEQQAKIREVYNDTGFVDESHYSFEIYGVYTDLSMAVREAKERQGHWLELPVNSSIPEALARYKPQGAPGSNSEQWYETTNPEVEHVPRSSLVQLAAVYDRVMAAAGTP